MNPGASTGVRGSMALRWLVIALSLVVAVRSAHAAPMEDYDLAGLVMHADAIVVADVGATSDGRTHYHVTRVLRGDLAVGAELAGDDSLYDTTTRDPGSPVYLFVHDGA